MQVGVSVVADGLFYNTTTGFKVVLHFGGIKAFAIFGKHRFAPKNASRIGHASSPKPFFGKSHGYKIGLQVNFIVKYNHAVVKRNGFGTQIEY